MTAKDIAKELNLSVSTVGRALANDSRISVATRERVMDAAKRSGYVANRAAQMMRGVSSKLVGLVLPDLGNSQHSVGAQALSKWLAAEGYQLVLSETNDDPDAELRHVRELCSASAAGIVIVPSAKPRAETVRLLKATPHVQWIRRHPSLGDQWFCFDNMRALHDATRHLIDLGHSRIGYVGLPPSTFAGNERLQGFLAAQAGAVVDKELMVFGPGASPEFGRDAMCQLLALKLRPSALVLGSLQITRGVLDEVVSRDMRIPEELSIVGFGDEPGFRWWRPGLTTITVPNAEIATSCGLWLLHRLKNQETVSGSPFGSLTPGALVVRGSSRRINDTDLDRGPRALTSLNESDDV